jgi:dienelactone hydrolase
MLKQMMYFSRLMALLSFCSFAPNYVAAEFGESTLFSHPAFYHKQGPEEAKGALVWSAGANIEARAHPTLTDMGIPHFLDWIYGSGWDVFFMERVGGIQHSDRQQHAEAIRNAVQGLQKAGYGKIILGGQSSGGLYSMLAAQQPLDIHALILTASGPSNGPISFAEALSKVKANRLIVAHFPNDQVIGKRSLGEIQAALSTNLTPTLNLFEPEGFEGHGAAFLSSFSKSFGKCIVDFLDASTVRSKEGC